MVEKQFLMPPLFDDQEKRIRTHTFAERSQKHLAADFTAFDQAHFFGDRAERDQVVSEFDLLINFQCSRLHTDRFRIRCGGRFFVDDLEIDVKANELRCQPPIRSVPRPRSTHQFPWKNIINLSIKICFNCEYSVLK